MLVIVFHLDIGDDQIPADDARGPPHHEPAREGDRAPQRHIGIGVIGSEIGRLHLRDILERPVRQRRGERGAEVGAREILPVIPVAQDDTLHVFRVPGYHDDAEVFFGPIHPDTLRGREGTPTVKTITTCIEPTRHRCAKSKSLQIPK